jgi:signal transduction histidine kinase
VGSLPLVDRYLERMDESEQKQKIQKHLKQIQSGIGHAVDICNHLRVYNGTSKINFSAIKVKELCDAVIVIIGNTLKLKNINLSLNIEEGLQVPGNRIGLQEVFLNLISNAIDVLPNGGEIRIGACSKEEKWCEITVSDSGPGIPKEIQSKIFDPFFTTKEVGKGTGLGLSIVFGTVNQHNGKIAVESEVGKYTKFIIRLPKSREV